MKDPTLKFLQIYEGDTVTVHYCDRPEMTAVVVSVPEQTGAMWILEDVETGDIIYQNPMSSYPNYIKVKP